MIKIDNVTKRYRDSDTLSLDNISLDIPDGSIVGLIGVNGLRYKLKKLSFTSLR